MGPLQRTPGTASTAFSQDPPWLRRRERISLVKNRMREICTSGSVRDGDGNAPIYSALDSGSEGDQRTGFEEGPRMPFEECCASPWRRPGIESPRAKADRNGNIGTAKADPASSLRTRTVEPVQ